MLVWIGIDAEFGTQRFCVQAPAFVVGGKPCKAPELRQCVVFLLQRYLEMVARYRFVQEQRFHRPLWARLDVVCIRVKYSCPGSIGRASLIRTTGGGLLAELLDTAHFEGRLRKEVKESGRESCDAVRHIPISLDQLLGLIEEKLFVSVQKVEEFLEIAFEANLLHDAAHLAVDTGDFVQANLVNLVRDQVRRRAHADQKRIPRFSVGQIQQPECLARGAEVVVTDKVFEARECRHDFVRNRILVRDREPCAIFLAETLRHVANRREKAAVPGIFGDQ